MGPGCLDGDVGANQNETYRLDCLQTHSILSERGTSPSQPGLPLPSSVALGNPTTALL